MITRLVICGIPGSGTKLLNHMIHAALPDWDYSPEERSWNALPEWRNVITKQPGDIFNIAEILECKDTAVIMTIRDPYFVLTGKHRGETYWMTAESINGTKLSPLDYCREAVKWQTRVPVVRYERLVTHPVETQHKLGYMLNLSWHGSFVDYMTASMPAKYKRLNVRRPLSTARTKLTPEDEDYLAEQLRKCPELERVRAKLGYGEV